MIVDVCIVGFNIQGRIPVGFNDKFIDTIRLSVKYSKVLIWLHQIYHSQVYYLLHLIIIKLEKIFLLKIMLLQVLKTEEDYKKIISVLQFWMRLYD